MSIRLKVILTFIPFWGIHLLIAWLLNIGDEVTGESHARSMVLLSTVASVLFLTINVIIAADVRRRVRRFLRATRLIEKGDYDHLLPESGPGSNQDEFAELSAEFNRMIRKLRNARKEIAQQQIRMMGSARLSAIGQMAGGIAHEVNNPLYIIQRLSSQATEELDKEQPDLTWVRWAAVNIESTANRISRIVKSLNTFARNSSTEKLEIVSIQKLLSETLEFCSERFKNHDIMLNMLEVNPSLQFECRPIQLSQVLINLLNNAHDAIVELGEKWITIAAQETGDCIEISVTDSGSGIPDPIRPQIFAPFFTTKEVGKGTGLGLSVSKGIVDAHHGEIFVDTSCKNTRFVIRIPKSQAPAAQATVTHAAA